MTAVEITKGTRGSGRTGLLEPAGLGGWMRPVVIALLAVPVVLSVAVPLAAWSGWDEGADDLRGFFAKVCHQRPERSFNFLGLPLGVCARCTGVYLGLLAGAVASQVLAGIVRPRPVAARRAFLVLVAVAVAHPVAGRFGVVPDLTIVRAITAFLAAAAVGGLLAAALTGSTVRSRRTVHGDVHAEA